MPRSRLVESGTCWRQFNVEAEAHAIADRRNFPENIVRSGADLAELQIGGTNFVGRKFCGKSEEDEEGKKGTRHQRKR